MSPALYSEMGRNPYREELTSYSSCPDICALSLATREKRSNGVAIILSRRLKYWIGRLL